MIETLEDVLARCTVDAKTRCWHWTGAVKAKYNTPVFYDPVAGQGIPGRRAVWELINGKLPRGKYVVMKCDCVDCLYIGHMRPVTRGQLMRKANLRRTAATIARMTVASRKRPDRKLTIEKAREIRARLAANETVTEISKDLGISRSTTHLVKHNHIWRESTPWGVI